MTNRFSTINAIIDNEKLTSTQKAILCCLWRYSNTDNISYPSITTILKGSGISNKRTLYNNLEFLIAEGYLQKESFQGKGCVYKIALGDNEPSSSSASSNITSNYGQYRTINTRKTENKNNNIPSIREGGTLSPREKFYIDYANAEPLTDFYKNMSQELYNYINGGYLMELSLEFLHSKFIC